MRCWKGRWPTLCLTTKLGTPPLNRLLDSRVGEHKPRQAFSSRRKFSRDADGAGSNSEMRRVAFPYFQLLPEIAAAGK